MINRMTIFFRQTVSSKLSQTDLIDGNTSLDGKLSQTDLIGGNTSLDGKLSQTDLIGGNTSLDGKLSQTDLIDGNTSLELRDFIIQQVSPELEATSFIHLSQFLEIDKIWNGVSIMTLR